MADIVSFIMFFCTCTSSKIAVSLPINLISHSISPKPVAIDNSSLSSTVFKNSCGLIL